MSARTYLSIGDVLTLLREEFPDVTISKIRFLESQGLVNPERSPSGYRKFFDHDVERLRWVLRQQREHFLPLKVIRDRLEDGELDDGEAAAVNGGTKHQGAGVTAAEGTETSAPAGAVATQVADHSSAADDEVMARILADASRRAAQIPAEPPGRRGLQVVGEATASTPDATAPDAAATDAAATDATDPAPDGQAGSEAEKVTVSASAAARGAGSRRAGSGGGGANGSPASGGRRAKGSSPDAPGPTPGPAVAARRPTPPDGGTAGGSAGNGFTLEELSAASGLSPEEVKGLQSFGLVESVQVAGIETFDEDALTVAKLAASFRAYGVEPRHLRLYRNAVDREVGLIEQVVIPLLRLRNPESRHRAVESADELASLGESMRVTLLRAALRRHLGG